MYRGFLRGVDVAVKAFGISGVVQVLWGETAPQQQLLPAASFMGQVLEDADGSFYDEVRALSRAELSREIADLVHSGQESRVPLTGRLFLIS